MSDAVLEVLSLSKFYGAFKAVDDVSFSLRPGEILGMLGPNGAGKTTTLKIINGLTLPSLGQVRLFGLDAEKNRSKLKKRLGYMSQKFSLYPLLTAVENLSFFGGLFGLDKKTMTRQKAELQERIGESLGRIPVGDLPPGLRQVVALKLCLMTDPQLIFLDEPTSGVDPQVRRDFWQDIYRLKEQGKSLIVSTHNLDEVAYTDRLLLMHQGRLILDGPLDELLASWKLDSTEELFISALEHSERKPGSEVRP